MKEKIQKQIPVFSYELANSAKCDVFEEFGFYTVYINGKMCSSHETLEKAKRKIQYLNDKALDQASNPGYKYHRDYNGKERKRNNV